MWGRGAFAQVVHSQFGPRSRGFVCPHPCVRSLRGWRSPISSLVAWRCDFCGSCAGCRSLSFRWLNAPSWKHLYQQRRMLTAEIWRHSPLGGGAREVSGAAAARGGRGDTLRLARTLGAGSGLNTWPGAHHSAQHVLGIGFGGMSPGTRFSLTRDFMQRGIEKHTHTRHQSRCSSAPWLVFIRMRPMHIAATTAEITQAL